MILGLVLIYPCCLAVLWQWRMSWERCSLISLSMTYAVRSSASSASLQMTRGWVAWLTQQKERILSRDTWEILRNKSMRISQSSTIQVQGAACGPRTILDKMGEKKWEKMSLKAALQRRTWGLWWIKSRTWANKDPRRPNVSWAASKGEQPAGHGKGFYCSTLPLWDPTWRAEFRSGFLTIIEMWASWGESKVGEQKWLGLWSMYAIKTGWKSCIYSIWRREGSRDILLSSSSTLRGLIKEWKIDFLYRQIGIGPGRKIFN